jgi:putative sterol carrier protein
MAVFPSAEWMSAYEDLINASAEYREAAATWEGAILDLWHGECRGARLIDAEEGSTTPYVIRAPYSRWKEVLRGDLDPVKGMMQGKLGLQGDLATIVRYIRAADELVNLTTQVPTQFLDEQAAAGR